MSAAAVAALALAMGGCSASTTATPSLTPSPATSSPATCDARQTLSQVDELLAGRTFEAHYLTINDQLTISVWLVDPDIDPSGTQEGLAAGNRQALATGLSLSYQIVDRIPCVRQVFENVNPMIVDARYQSWYIDIIPVRAFFDLRDPTTEQLVGAVERTGVGPGAGRRNPPPTALPRPSGSCSWPEARAAIAGELGAERRNAAAYLIIGASLASSSQWSGPVADVDVQAQWDTSSPAEATDPAILERLGHLAEALACLSPRVDQLEVFVVDQTGRLVVYGRVPGMLIGPKAAPLRPDVVLLQRYPEES